MIDVRSVAAVLREMTDRGDFDGLPIREALAYIQTDEGREVCAQARSAAEVYFMHAPPVFTTIAPEEP